MKLWTTATVLAWGVLFPLLSHAQQPWVQPGPAAYGYCPPVGAEPGLYDQLLPDAAMQYGTRGRGCLDFGEAFSQSYARLDYLSWRIGSGNHTLLGAPNSSGADLSGQDTSNMLQASDAIGPRTPAPTFAVVPSLNDHHNILNGLRGTIGIPTKVGTLETEVFYLEQSENNQSVMPYTITNPSVVTTSPVIAATTLLTNGAIDNDNMILYSESYYAMQKSSIFGSEANWIFNAFTPNQPFVVKPTLGFRYFNLRDQLTIRGVDHPDATDPTVTLNHMISSIARNNIFGPQIGLNASTNIWRFDFGAETKFMAGINRLTTGVSTQQIYSPTEANRSVDDGQTRFAPAFDLSLSAKYHLTEYINLFVSYELFVGAGFSRAYNNVYYDAPVSTTAPSQITVHTQISNFLVQGIAIGGEIQFR